MLGLTYTVSRTVRVMVVVSYWIRGFGSRVKNDKAQTSLAAKVEVRRTRQRGQRVLSSAWHCVLARAFNAQ